VTWLADVVLAATAVEALLLLLFGRRLGHGITPSNTMAMLLPGAALVLALRLALGGSGWKPIALALLLAGLLHAHDLIRRLFTSKGG
jgi:hypothetical protein